MIITETLLGFFPCPLLTCFLDTNEILGGLVVNIIIKIRKISVSTLEILM